MIKAVGRLARQKLKSAGKKAKLKSAQAQVDAYNKGREVKQKVGDKVRGAKVGLKAKIKKAAQKVVDRMSEEVSGDEKNELQKNQKPDPATQQSLSNKEKIMKKQMTIQKQKLQLQKQGKLPVHSEEKKKETAFDLVKRSMGKSFIDTKKLPKRQHWSKEHMRDPGKDTYSKKND